MPHPITKISAFTFDKLNKELQLETDVEKACKTFLKAYNGDFWQDGAGSLLPPASGVEQSVLNTLFEKRFVFRNVIQEVVGRVAGAFFGRAPNWRFRVGGEDVQPKKDAASSEEAEAVEDSRTDLEAIDKALSEFWTKQNVAGILNQAFESRLVFGRGGIRVFIPTRFKQANIVQDEEADPESVGAEAASQDFVKFNSIEEAIKAMRVEFIPPEQGKLLDDGGELFSIVRYSVRDDWETQKDIKVIEFSFVDNSDGTMIGTIKENESLDIRAAATGAPIPNLSSVFDLAAFTTFNQFKGKPYITHALYKNNQLLNLALTCAGFSLVDNGFGEMVLTNVALQTRKIPNPDGDGDIDVPVSLRRGGGVVNNFVGLTEMDPTTGQERVGTPGVTFKEPTPLQAFKDGEELAYVSCLKEVGQLYALISGDATASGESRIQALADFLLRIMPYKTEVDEMGTWLLTVVLRWAAELALLTVGDTFVVYDSRVHIATLSTEEKNTVMTMRQKGSISRETERVLLGIDDPALEADRIKDEQGAPMEEQTTEDLSEKLDVALKMLSINLPMSFIQKYIGLTEEQIAELAQIAADEQAALEAQIAAQTGAPGGGGLDGLPPGA